MSKMTVILMMAGLATMSTVACAVQPGAVTAPGEVVAKVGDQTITEAELEDAAGPTLMRLRQQMYDAKRQALDAKIFDLLTQKAAAESGKTKEQWMAENLVVTEPTEEQIAAVMSQYRSRLAKEDDKARQQVVDYLNQQAQQQAASDLKDRLMAEAGVEIYLDPPRVEPKMTDYSPERGPEDAPVTLIEYTDFQCPYCSRVQPTLDTLQARYGDKLRFVFKNLPLAMHSQAKFAAEAAMCAADQDGFWPMHDWMFKNQRGITREAVVGQAEEQGLDLDEFNACLDENRHSAEVAQDMSEANSFGITGTPGFVINGRILNGAQPLEAFTNVIDDELRRAGVAVPEPPQPTTKTKTEEAASEAEAAN